MSLFNGNPDDKRDVVYRDNKNSLALRTKLCVNSRKGYAILVLGDFSTGECLAYSFSFGYEGGKPWKWAKP